MSGAASASEGFGESGRPVGSLTVASYQPGRRYSSIERELRSQYLITYRSTNDKYDGSYRRVEVKLTNRDGLKLRTKKGYKAVADAVRTGG